MISLCPACKTEQMISAVVLQANRNGVSCCQCKVKFNPRGHRLTLARERAFKRKLVAERLDAEAVEINERPIGTQQLQAAKNKGEVNERVLLASSNKIELSQQECDGVKPAASNLSGRVKIKNHATVEALLSLEGNQDVVCEKRINEKIIQQRLILAQQKLRMEREKIELERSKLELERERMKLLKERMVMEQMISQSAPVASYDVISDVLPRTPLAIDNRKGRQAMHSAPLELELIPVDQQVTAFRRNLTGRKNRR